MSESIFQRVNRILNAKIEDAVDRMERSGSDSVMREAIREVDRAIEQVRGDYEMAKMRRLQAVRQQGALQERGRVLTEKARFALAEGREDLAEAALSRQVDFEDQAGKLEAVQGQAAADEMRLSESLAALEARKREMEDAMSAFLAARGPAAASHDGETPAKLGVERRVHRAEQAFDRAMSGAGGQGFSRADGATINRVAEIDVMQRRSMVAARLDALKQTAAAV